MQYGSYGKEPAYHLPDDVLVLKKPGLEWRNTEWHFPIECYYFYRWKYAKGTIFCVPGLGLILLSAWLSLL